MEDRKEERNMMIEVNELVVMVVAGMAAVCFIVHEIVGLLKSRK